MTNLIILLVVWCTGIVLCHAWIVAWVLRRAFRPEVRDGEEGEAAGGASVVLAYAKAPPRGQLLRRWLALVAAVAVVLLLMLPPALPVIGLIVGHTYQEAGAICAMALVATLVAVVFVSARGMSEVGGRPAAANWLPGRAMVCWAIVLVLTWSVLAWRTQSMLSEMVARGDEAAQRLAITGDVTAASLYRQAGIGQPTGPGDEDRWWFMAPDGRTSPPPPVTEQDEARVMLLRRAAAMHVSGLGATPDEYASDAFLSRPSQMRSSAWPLRMHAANEARAGRVESALGDVNAIQGLADHIGQGLSTMEAILSASTRNVGFDALQHVLPFVREERVLDGLVLPESSWPLSIMRRGIEGTFCAENRWVLAERLRGRRLIDNSWSTRESRFPFDDWGVLMFLYRTALGELDVRLIEDLAAQVPPMAPSDPAMVNTSPIRMNGWILPTHASSFVADKLAFGVGGHVDPAVEQSAMCELARAAVAATRFRLRQGRLPASFDELVQTGLLPAVPMDPFSGKAMRLAVGDEYVFIYSLGGMRRDLGGTPYILAAGGEVVQGNPGMILSDRPLWELPLAPPGVPATQPAAEGER